MVFHVVAVGRVRNAALREACEDYQARASRYFKLEIREVPDAGRRPATDALRVESAALVKRIPRGALSIGLTREGKSEDSPSFARRISRWQDEARDIAFLIGGAFGLQASLLDDCDGRLSLSHWTLPHELARLVLLEQLYRAGTILAGQPYHKGPR
jgi:23S rRNA (pseudouridine1915-N3)-methyltransferase